MFRLSGDFIYALAGRLRPIDTLNYETTGLQAFYVLNGAVEGLKGLFVGNPLGIRASWSKGQELMSICTSVIDSILADPNQATVPIGGEKANWIKTAFTTFEITFKSELAVANLYVLTSKGAYDLNILAEQGVLAFPEMLEVVVPEAKFDAAQAARCLAFELPTSAAFHMHRAHEAVIHAYFKELAPDVTPPDRQPLGAWITALEGQLAPGEVVAAIRDINKLHRNPVLHPENTLTHAEEAIALLGSINTSIRYMLKNMTEIAVRGANI